MQPHRVGRGGCVKSRRRRKEILGAATTCPKVQVRIQFKHNGGSSPWLVSEGWYRKAGMGSFEEATGSNSGIGGFVESVKACCKRLVGQVEDLHPAGELMWNIWMEVTV
jgi:hypothetical protein